MGVWGYVVRKVVRKGPVVFIREERERLANWFRVARGEAVF